MPMRSEDKAQTAPLEQRVERKGAPLAEGAKHLVHELVDGQLEVTLIKNDGAGDYKVVHTGTAESVRARCEIDAAGDKFALDAIKAAIPVKGETPIDEKAEPMDAAVSADLTPRRG